MIVNVLPDGGAVVEVVQDGLPNIVEVINSSAPSIVEVIQDNLPNVVEVFELSTSYNVEVLQDSLPKVVEVFQSATPNVVEIVTAGPQGPIGPVGPIANTDSFLTTSSFNSYTGSSTSQFAGTGSYALTASYALNAGGGGGASFPYTGSAIITGSLIVVGPVEITGSLKVSESITGSLQGTASFATQALSASYIPNLQQVAEQGRTFRTSDSNGIVVISDGIAEDENSSTIRVEWADPSYGTAIIGTAYANGVGGNFKGGRYGGYFASNNIGVFSVINPNGNSQIVIDNSNNVSVIGYNGGNGVGVYGMGASEDGSQGTGGSFVGGHTGIYTSGNALGINAYSNGVVATLANNSLDEFGNPYSGNMILVTTSEIERFKVDGTGKVTANNITSNDIILSPKILINTTVDNGLDKLQVSGSTNLNGNTTITGSLRVSQGITGSLLGTASRALLANSVNVFDNTSYGGITFYPVFASTSSGATTLNVDSQTFTYNPETNTLNTTSSRAISSSYTVSSSNALTASSVSTLTQDVSIARQGGPTLTLTAATAGSSTIVLASNSTGGGDAVINSTLATGDLVLKVSGSEKLRIKPDGTFSITGSIRSLLVGTGSSFTAPFYNGFVPNLSIGMNTGSTGAVLDLRNTSGSVSAGETLGTIQFTGIHQGSNYVSSQIKSTVTNTISSGFNGGGNIAFWTAPTNAGASPVERMRVNDLGQVLIGLTSSLDTTSELIVSGSTTITGSLNVTQGITGSLFGTATTASFVTGSVFTSVNPALSASYALTASFALNGGGGAAFPFSGSAVITGSLLVSGSGLTVTGSLRVSQGITGSLLGTASRATTASVSDKIYITNSPSQGANYLLSTKTNTSDIYETPDKLTSLYYSSDSEELTLNNGNGTFVGNLRGTASFATNALTASYALNAGAAFPFTGSARITGSLIVTGSTTSTLGFIKPGAGSQYLLADGTTTTGTGGSPFPFIGDAQITGSLKVSGSITGSLFGTASYATVAASVLGGSTAFPFNGSAVITGSLSQGTQNRALSQFSHAEGGNTVASGDYSHAEGYFTNTSNVGAHSEGYKTSASGYFSHAEGGWYDFDGAPLPGGYAQGIGSHAEGVGTIAQGDVSHAEGYYTWATGYASHAEGSNTTASGDYSHTEGFGTFSQGTYQHVQGQWNIASSAQSAFIHGNGISNANRSNLIFASGSEVQITGSLKVSGSITGSLFGTATTAVSSSYALTASYALNAGGGGSASTSSYGSFYDTTTQTNPVANTPRSMSLNTTDITNGVSISGSTNPFNTYIKTQTAGVYNIQFSAQLDKTDGGTDEIVIWLRKNGINLTDTATSITLTGNNAKQVAAWNWFVSSSANDYYQIIWQSNDTEVRLFAEPADGHPGVPSVIVTANRVDIAGSAGAGSGGAAFPYTGNAQITGSLTVTQGITGSLFGTATTASFITGSVFTSANPALSSSYALTASYALTSGGGGAAFPYTGDAQITGSLLVNGSATFTGPISASDYQTTWTEYSGSSVIAGWAATPAYTQKNIRYMTIGKLAHVEYFINGTGATAVTTFTLPFSASGNVVTQSNAMQCFLGATTPIGMAFITSGSNRVNCLQYTTATAQAASWGGTGVKGVRGSLTIEIA